MLCQWLVSWWMRLRIIWKRSQLDQDLEDEIAFHLAMRTDKIESSGVSKAEASLSARREFGNVTWFQETCRNLWGFGTLEILFNDLRHGVRMLRRNPTFTAVAVLSLALGIGANVAIFSALNAVLLRSLPVRNPHELRIVNWQGRNPSLHNYTGTGMDTTGAGLTFSGSFPYPAFHRFQNEGIGFTDVFAYFPISEATAVTRGAASTADGLMVSGNFFSGYGARILRGRPITSEDDRPGAPLVAVITYRWWAERFGLDPDALGKTLTLNKTDFTIIGILPPDYVGLLPGDPDRFYIPFSAQPQMMPDYPLASANDWWIQVMARLAPGFSENQARASLEAVFRQVLRESETTMEQPGILLQEGNRGPLMVRERMAEPLFALMAVTGLVLLIACANLAGLLLARGEARQHEMAVRRAIGAGKLRLIRQSLTESLVLSLLGAGLGLILASSGARVLTGCFSMYQDNLHFDSHVDSNVLAFALGTAVLTALIFGLMPALQASRVDPLEGLKERAASVAPRLRMGKVLVVVQICLSVLLVSMSGLLVRTFANLRTLDPGFKSENVLLFRLNAGKAGYKGTQLIEFYENVRQSLSAIPGVRAIGLSDHMLVGGGMSSSAVTVPGRPANEHMQAWQMVVDESFFSTMGIPLLLGRNLSASDTKGSTPTVIVNETFARRFMGVENPLSKTFSIGKTNYQIVGMCRDARYADLRSDAPPTMYLPYRQRMPGSMYFEVRCAVPPRTIIPAVSKAVAALNSNIPLVGVRTQAEQLDLSTFQERVFALLCSTLATLAVLLACIGIYGVMAYTVLRRTGEIGIRVALGAAPGSVAGQVLREALILASAGIIGGIPAALAVAQLARGILFGVKPNDFVTFCGTAMVCLIVTALAAWIPARRAARINPILALKSE